MTDQDISHCRILERLAAQEGHSVWSATYELELWDVLVLQGELSRVIAQEIQLALSPAETARLAQARPVDPEAHAVFAEVTRVYDRVAEARKAIYLDPFTLGPRCIGLDLLFRGMLSGSHGDLATDARWAAVSAWAVPRAGAVRA